MSEALPRPLSNQKGFQLARTDVASVLISFYVCMWIVIGFVAASDQFLHWFVTPVLFCGILIGTDAVDWIRDRLSIFDPVGILGLLGFHFFFLAPLLHVYWDSWMRFVVPPPDWRDWLGGMAWLNALSLLVYRVFKSRFVMYEQEQSSQTVWHLDRHRFFVLAGCALLVTAVLQIRVYAQFGGILGYIGAATDEQYSHETFRGMGWIFMISESFPVLAMMLFAAYAKGKKIGKSWVVLAVVLLTFFVLRMLFGGVRGSRSNTIWGLFWAIGIIHYWLRPISKKIVLVGCVFLVLFMYLYGFFKGSGLDAVRAFEGAEARVELSEDTGRTFEGLILGDFGRSDVQAFLLYRLLDPSRAYEYAWGRTYLGAFAQLIPRSIWPDRPPTKRKEGTEIQYGAGYYIPEERESSRIYGLAGETMLNFGPVAVPLAFLLSGLVIACARRFMLTLDSSDSRLLLSPLLIITCFLLLVYDIDHILFVLIKNGAVPFLIVALSSTKQVVTNTDTRGLTHESPCYV